jgi:RND family efflux transporter MFP subunit
MGAVTVAAALVAAFSWASCKKEAPAAGIEEKAGVKVVVMKRQEINRDVSCFGSITFNKKVDVSSTVDGTVAGLFVKEGQKVRSGDQLLLMRNVQMDLNKAQAASSLNSARSSLELSEAKLWEGELGVEARLVEIEKTELELGQKRIELEDSERILANKEDLYKVGGVADETMSGLRLKVAGAKNECKILEKDLASKRIGLRDEDLARAGFKPAASERERIRQLVELNTKTLRADVAVARSRVDSAERDLEAAQELLRQLELRAPADGIVGAKYVEQGEYAVKNTKLLTLIDTKSVYASLSIQESEMPLLREGLPARIVVEAVSNRPLVGRVESISPIADPQTGAFVVKAAVANAGGGLRPGMFVRATIAYGAPQGVLVLPERCIVQKKGSQSQVFAVVNGKAFMKTIALGKDLGGSFVVESGLSAGDAVIDGPPPMLREGMDVEIVS